MQPMSEAPPAPTDQKRDMHNVKTGASVDMRNRTAGDVYRDIADESMPDIIESYCVNCGENVGRMLCVLTLSFQGTTRLLLVRIPFFKQVILMSFDCPHCNFHNNEVGCCLWDCCCCCCCCCCFSLTLVAVAVVLFVLVVALVVVVVFIFLSHNDHHPLHSLDPTSWKY
jgi:hypothetical protein